MMKRTLMLVISSLLLVSTLRAQGISRIYLDYIEKYDEMAIEQMKEHRIPASITMAQALLESAAGTSTLATKGNNHFGIKCGPSWKGRYIIRDDDAPNERFRHYKNARESYEDHSEFLKQPRYSKLFRLSIYDYEGWAKGLKECGYATNPRYSRLLIDLIERYDLHELDEQEKRGRKHRENQGVPSASLLPGEHVVYGNNSNYYIIARHGDTFESLSDETGVSRRKLRLYNELPKGYELQDGDVIYLEKKRSKASRAYRKKLHTVVPGESMYTIAQRYGIRLESLYKMNRMPLDYSLQPGDRLRLR